MLCLWKLHTISHCVLINNDSSVQNSQWHYNYYCLCFCLVSTYFLPGQLVKICSCETCSVAAQQTASICSHGCRVNASVCSCISVHHSQIFSAAECVSWASFWFFFITLSNFFLAWTKFYLSLSGSKHSCPNYINSSSSIT